MTITEPHRRQSAIGRTTTSKDGSHTMPTANMKRRLALAVAATMLGIGLTSGTTTADPSQYFAYVGVGADSTQDVMNALAGQANGIQYLAIDSGSATGNHQLVSFDATPTNGVGDACITTKINGPTFTRPNGSAAGRRALTAAALGTGWIGNSQFGSCSGTLVDISGAVNFARSVTGPSGIGADLTYVPFVRDALSFAHYRAAGNPVTTLTTAELTSLFTTGPQVIGGVRIVPCGVATFSTTYNFWNSAVTANSSTETAATAECNNLLGTNVRNPESDADGLKLRGDTLAAGAGTSGDQVVMGFSVPSFIAKSNGVDLPALPAGVGIGSITGLGSPVTGVAPDLAAAATFYNSTRFGRTAYNVIPSRIIDDVGNMAIKALFVGPTSKVCSSTVVITRFGFLTLPNCGDTTLRGPWMTGTS